MKYVNKMEHLNYFCFHNSLMIVHFMSDSSRQICINNRTSIVYCVPLLINNHTEFFAFYSDENRKDSKISLTIYY